MKAKHSVWKNKLVKTMFLLAVVSVAALFIGGAASAALQPGDTKTQDNKTITSLSNVYAKIDGLAPKTTAKYSPIQHQPVLDRGYFYAYNAYDPSGQHSNGPITLIPLMQSICLHLVSSRTSVVALTWTTKETG